MNCPTDAKLRLSVQRNQLGVSLVVHKEAQYPHSTFLKYGEGLRNKIQYMWAVVHVPDQLFGNSE